MYYGKVFFHILPNMFDSDIRLKKLFCCVSSKTDLKTFRKFFNPECISEDNENYTSKLLLLPMLLHRYTCRFIFLSIMYILSFTLGCKYNNIFLLQFHTILNLAHSETNKDNIVMTVQYIFIYRINCYVQNV